MLKHRWVGLWPLLVTWAAACSSGEGTQPPLAPCTATSGGQISLAIAAYVAIDPTQTVGCAVFPANMTAATIEYLLVPQAASGVVDDSSSFLLRGAAVAAAAPPAAAPLVAEVPGLQQRFDLSLRQAERQLALRFPAQGRALQAPSAARAPPQVGDVRSFHVCGDTLCATHPTVSATAKVIGRRIAVFVDNAAADTLATADLNGLAALVDTLLYPADTAAFGRESDVDGNGLVLVLMSPKINALTPKTVCPVYIAGLFYGGDLLLGFPGGNNAEIFYSIVPDPTGATSCAHGTDAVKHIVPVTFIHEFQHMISWGHHVTHGNGIPEDLWLNEGLSHYAEELGARLFVPQDTISFCYFIFGDVHNSAQYLANPESYFLVDSTGIGGLANRGAYWLFVRFLVDQFSADTFTASNDAFTRRLQDPIHTGAANVMQATGASFASLVGRWALANYVSDLPGFNAPSTLQYVKWRFRSDYPTIHNACALVGSNFPSTYPLAPGSGDGSALSLAGTLRSGSGSYYLGQQPVGPAGFTLLFSTGTGTALRTSLVPRLNVIRIH